MIGAWCLGHFLTWHPSRSLQPTHIVFKLIYRKFGNRMHAKDDLLSGLTVALALVPEAVAFAIIAGVSPIIGLYAALGHLIPCVLYAEMGARFMSGR